MEWNVVLECSVGVEVERACRVRRCEGKERVHLFACVYVFSRRVSACECVSVHVCALFAVLSVSARVSVRAYVLNGCTRQRHHWLGAPLCEP